MTAVSPMDDRQLSSWESSAEALLEGDHSYAISSLSKHDYARRIVVLVGEVRRLQTDAEEAHRSAQTAWDIVERVRAVLDGLEAHH